jgi:hypothetical protein
MVLGGPNFIVAFQNDTTADDCRKPKSFRILSAHPPRKSILNEKDDAPGLPPTSEWPLRWRYVAFVAAAIAFIVILAAATQWASSVAPVEQSIAQQWNDAIKRLGFEPVYPPVEDIAVGDVFAIITEDAAANTIPGEPFAGRSIKLVHLDLTEDIENAYRQMYQFPDTIVRPAQSSLIWQQSVAQGSLFKAPAARTALPLVLFPQFTIARSRQASGEGGLTGLWQAGFGSAGSSSELIDVRISGTETYGIPAIPAEIRLLNFCSDKSTQHYCSDKGLRRQLSIIVGSKINDAIKDPKTGSESPRFSVELALVSRVFMTRSIETSIRSQSASSAQGNLAQRAAWGTSESPGVADGKNEKPDAQPEQQSKQGQPAVVGNGQMDASGAKIAIQRETSSGVLLPDTVTARPVVIGFKSVRWKP